MSQKIRQEKRLELRSLRIIFYFKTTRYLQGLGSSLSMCQNHQVFTKILNYIKSLCVKMTRHP